VTQYDESNPHHHHSHSHNHSPMQQGGAGASAAHQQHPLFRFGGGGGGNNNNNHHHPNNLFMDESQQHHPVQYGGDDHHHHQQQQHMMMQMDSHQPQSSSSSSRPTQDGSSLMRHGSFRDWRTLDSSSPSSASSPSSPGSRLRNAAIGMSASGSHTINPNDEDVPPTVLVHGRGPGRRAGHTATAVHRKIYVFGGSCGSDYLNDFYVLDTDPPPQAEVTESNTLQLLERRLRHFFNDPEFADVVFVVQGGHKVYGHKMVLSMVSDCFRAMFTTGFRETSEGEIEIPDCTYLGFVSVMEYIYTSQLPAGIVESLHQDALYMTSPPSHRQYHHHNSTTNGSSSQQQAGSAFARVVEMLELADRFFLDHLKQLCEALLQPLVNADTVEYLLGVSQKTNAVQLQAVCEHFVRNR
jgi:BTB/POZ domain/Kelch motif